jgi:hypothetical protein
MVPPVATMTIRGFGGDCASTTSVEAMRAAVKPAQRRYEMYEHMRISGGE